MPKIDIDKAPVRRGSDYPAPFDAPVRGRVRHRLGDAGGLSQFGVNLMRLPPGGWSSQRHWHSAEDEFVYVLEGEGVLVTEAGEQVLRPGDCAAFPAGLADGHHIQNRSQAELVLLEVGSRRPQEDTCNYPDIDMFAPAGADGYTRRDGTPY